MAQSLESKNKLKNNQEDVMALYILFGIIVAGTLLYITVSFISIKKSRSEIDQLFE